jgi:2,4-dienoyl-CoA reductase-like NADH-dependent reductase (Old Yellow Enzyme family)
MRLAMEIIDITRSTLSPEKPVFVRISATDNSPDGEMNEAGEYISW